MGHSAIVIPVAELEPVVRARMRQSIPAYLFDDPAAIHAHITLLGPFVERDAMDEQLTGYLRDFFQQTAAFTFTLNHVPQALQDGTICLVPHPAEPFQTLTHALWSAYPDHPPYSDAFSAPRHHLTLVYPWAPKTATADLSQLSADVKPLAHSPIQATVACLNWYEPFRSHTVACFELGL